MKPKMIALAAALGALFLNLSSAANAQDMYGTFTGEPPYQSQLRSTSGTAQPSMTREQARMQNSDSYVEISSDPTSLVWQGEIVPQRSAQGYQGQTGYHGQDSGLIEHGGSSGN